MTLAAKPDRNSAVRQNTTRSGTPATDAVAPPRETRECLIKATRDLMIEHGILEVSLAEITRRAGVNIALVSYHFGGREGLMLAVAEADAVGALSELTRLCASTRSPTEKLWRHVAALVAAHFERPYLNRLLQKLLREGSPAAAAQLGEKFVRPVFERRKEILAEGASRGEFRDVDPGLVGFAIDGACAQIFSSAASRSTILGSGTLSADLARRYAELTADIIVQGVQAPTPANERLQQRATDWGPHLGRIQSE
jgi:TetR/AcrR family transcriptional regulator